MSERGVFYPDIADLLVSHQVVDRFSAKYILKDSTPCVPVCRKRIRHCVKNVPRNYECFNLRYPIRQDVYLYALLIETFNYRYPAKDLLARQAFLVNPSLIMEEQEETR